MFKYTLLLACVLSSLALGQTYEYRVLATKKTSTMEKEMNQAAGAGYVFSGVMGGETAVGSEVVVVMAKSSQEGPRRQYRLLATSKTSTMEKEMQQAAAEGFEYMGQTVFESTFGGKEVGVIMEREAGAPSKGSQYRLLATSRTSTMQKELQEAGSAGFSLLGMTVAKTAFGGSEIVCIMRKTAQ